MVSAGDEPRRALRNGVVAVGRQGKSHRRVAGAQGVFPAVDLYGALSLDHDGDFHGFMHMQREGIFRHLADIKVFLPKLIEGFQRVLPPFIAAVSVPIWQNLNKSYGGRHVIICFYVPVFIQIGRK